MAKVPEKLQRAVVPVEQPVLQFDRPKSLQYQLYNLQEVAGEELDGIVNGTYLFPIGRCLGFTSLLLKAA